MAMAAFDTLKLTRSLEGAGMARAQAEAFADAFREGIGETLATKGDIEELKHEISGVRSDLSGEIASVRSELAIYQAQSDANLRRLELRMYATMAAFTGIAMGIAKLIF